MNRRDALKTMGTGFGMTALGGMLGGAALHASQSQPVGTHFAPKAKRVIFLFLNGGPSQVDTFDPKPALEKFHGTTEPERNYRSRKHCASRNVNEIAVHVQKVRSKWN